MAAPLSPYVTLMIPISHSSAVRVALIGEVSASIDGYGEDADGRSPGKARTFCHCFNAALPAFEAVERQKM